MNYSKNKGKISLLNKFIANAKVKKQFNIFYFLKIFSVFNFMNKLNKKELRKIKCHRCASKVSKQQRKIK